MASMTSTEMKARRMLLNMDVRNLRFFPKRSPDFVFEGGNVEVKRLNSDNFLTFTPGQMKCFKANTNVEIWIFDQHDALVTKTTFKSLDESMSPPKLEGYSITIVRSTVKICITISLAKAEVDFIDELVKAGDFDSRSACFRALTRNAMRKRKLEIPLS